MGRSKKRKVTFQDQRVTSEDTIDIQDNSGVADSEEEENSEDEFLQSKFHDSSDDVSSEEEVLGIHSESEDEFEDATAGLSDSDLDEPDQGIPDAKAWGKKKKLYYNADHINEKDIQNEDDEEAIRMEEEEALAIQKRLASEIDDADLSLHIFTGQQSLDDVEDGKGEKIEMDVSALSEQERLNLFKKESPEFFELRDDYKTLMAIAGGKLKPVLDLAKCGKISESSGTKFVETLYNLILNYCTNITFYLLLKTRRSHVKTHPVMNRLSEYKTLISKLMPLYNDQIESCLDEIISTGSNVGAVISKKRKKIKKKVKERLEEQKSRGKTPAKGILSNKATLGLTKEMNVPIKADEEKRSITYQIAKNKGLTPHRKKEFRNPRVKNRLKYRKAKIRRKGQVREVRKETERYGGEISGIKTSTVKSIKFKY